MQITPLLLLSLFGSSYCVVFPHAARATTVVLSTTEGASSTASNPSLTTTTVIPNPSCIASPSAAKIPESAFSTVYTLPNGHYAENLAVRSNGKVLVTVIGAPEIWQIDPVTSTGQLLYTFPGGPDDGNCTLGITEYAPDKFAVAVGKFNIPTVSGVASSWAIWSFDLSAGDVGVSPKIITAIAPAVFLNGLTSQPPNKSGHFLLVADSYLGIIYRIDITKGTWTTFLDDPSLKRNASAAIQLGVNGIRVHNNYLYFDNSGQAPMFARVLVSTDLKAIGSVEVIVAAAAFPVNAQYYGYDDFAFNGNGDAWMATNPSRSIVKIHSDGRQFVEVGGLNEGTLTGCTSVQFGRGSESTILYVNVNAQGGKLLKVDTVSPPPC
ncbi:hypothetical protein VTL71DRAFT_4950 [Oculimacula yallundae]|uniref:Uncharacterized protein n=1 Tax=Oculimacula yallundae TaxID=86028 RepID=A0ABR4C541_9HELO